MNLQNPNKMSVSPNPINIKSYRNNNNDTERDKPAFSGKNDKKEYFKGPENGFNNNNNNKNSMYTPQFSTNNMA